MDGHAISPPPTGPLALDAIAGLPLEAPILPTARPQYRYAVRAHVGDYHFKPMK